MAAQHAPTLALSRTPCWNFAEHGSCRFGHQCRFLHAGAGVGAVGGIGLGGAGGGGGRGGHHISHAAGPRIGGGGAPAIGGFYRRGAHAPTPGTPGRVWLELKEEEPEAAAGSAGAAADATPAAAAAAAGHEAAAPPPPSPPPPPPPLRPLPLRFRTLSYNCLADELAYAHAAELYRAVPRDLLSWPGRLAGLVAEIAHWRPSICLLQEVDRADDVRQELSKLGYKMKHAPRTGGRSDGCLTAYKRAEFELVHSETIAMADHGLRDNVALILVLRPKARAVPAAAAASATAAAPAAAAAAAAAAPPAAAAAAAVAPGEKKEGEEEAKDRAAAASAASAAAEEEAKPQPPQPQPPRPLPPHAPFLVANTHLLFNPKRGDVKLAQARTLLAKAAAVASKFAVGHALLGGDFNATPGSAVYEFVSGGELRNFAALDRRVLSGQLVGGAGGQGSFAGPAAVAPPHAPSASLSARVLRAEEDVAARFPAFASVRDQAAGRYGGMRQQQPQGQQQQGQGQQQQQQHGQQGQQLQTAPTAEESMRQAEEEGRDVDTDDEFDDDDDDEMEASSSSPSQQNKKKKKKKKSTMAKGSGGGSGDGGDGGGDVVEVDAAVSVVEVEMSSSSSQEQQSDGKAAAAAPPTASISGTWTLEQLHMVIGTTPPEASGDQQQQQQNGGGGAQQQQQQQQQQKKKGSSSSEATADAAASRAAAQINDASAWVAKHPLSLKSAYRSVAGAEPAFTSAHGGFVGTVDYLWFTPQSLLTEEAIRALESKNRQLAAKRANKKSSSGGGGGGGGGGAGESNAPGAAESAPTSPQPPPTAAAPPQPPLPPLPPVPQRTTLSAVAALAPPPLASLPQGLPSASFPSDHVAVVVDFVVK